MPPPRTCLVAALPITLALACGADTASEHDVPATTTAPATPASAADHASGDRLSFAPSSSSRRQAQDALQSRDAEVMSRRSACFTMVRARSGPLGKASSTSERMSTLIDFLGAYGSAFVDKGKASLSEEVELEVVRPGIQVEQGTLEANDILLRQVVDDFGLADSLIGGRFVGNDLVFVSGCLADPATSPARTKSLAVPTADAARAAFAAELGAGVDTGSAPVKGRMHGRFGTVRWLLHDHRLDAETGEYLGKKPAEEGDPAISNTPGQ